MTRGHAVSAGIPSPWLASRPGAESGRLLFYLRLPADFAQVEVARLLGAEFCEAAYRDPALVQRMSVIIHECVENAVKYAAAGASREFALAVFAERDQVVVSVCSAADPEQLPSLRAELVRVASSEPRGAFAAALARAAAEPHQAARLGLARVRYEGEAELSLEEHGDGRICLTARGSL